MVVFALEGKLMVAAGPLSLVQVVVTIFAPLVPAAVPERVAELVGMVTVWAVPALTVGAVLTAPPVTVTVTEDVLLRP